LPKTLSSGIWNCVKCNLAKDANNASVASGVYDVTRYAISNDSSDASESHISSTCKLELGTVATISSTMSESKIPMAHGNFVGIGRPRSLRQKQNRQQLLRNVRRNFQLRIVTSNFPTPTLMTVVRLHPRLGVQEQGLLIKFGEQRNT
jgi:hypothetical protein